MSDPNHSVIPHGVQWLGWSGVLPFAGAVALAAVAPPWRPEALLIFVAYGAVILSFLGGARWGRALADAGSVGRYAEAVLPSLIGFAAMLLLRWPAWSLGLLAAGFAIWLALDWFDPRWPPAYRRMRAGITVVVVLLHAAWFVV